MAHDREREHWEREARGRSLGLLEREAGFLEREPLWGWARERARALGPGRVLDLGCGRGATSVLLAREQPCVVGADVALEALRAGRRLAAREPRPPAFVAGALEALPFAASSFDLVTGRFVLHHAASLEAASAELARVLRPGGVGLFIETWGANPLLRAGRDLAQRLGVGIGTEDERPLTRASVRLLERHFSVELAWPQLMLLGLSDRVWRRLRPWCERSAWVRSAVGRSWQAAIDGDRWLERRVPGLRGYGWFVALELRRR